MIEKISTSQSPAYISLTFPSYEALSEEFKSDKRKPRMSPAGTHGVLSGQINIRLSTCLIPEGAVVLKCEYLKGEHKRKGAFTCYRSGRKRAAISFWEASGNSAQSCTSTKIGMSLSRSAVRSASTARQGRKSADDKIEIASRMSLSRQVVTVCPDLGVGNEGAEQAQISSLIADSRKSSFHFIGFAWLSTLSFGQCPRIGYKTFNLPQRLFRNGFPVVVGGKIPVVPIRDQRRTSPGVSRPCFAA